MCTFRDFHDAVKLILGSFVNHIDKAKENL